LKKGCVASASSAAAMFVPPRSAGVGPSASALGSVPEAELRKLLWGTTSGTSATRGLASGTGEERQTNYSDVHSMGARDTKYMKKPKKTAPLLDRSALSSSRAFVEHPLDQAALNTMFASVGKGPMINLAGQGVATFKDAKTMYASSHQGFSEEQMRTARSPSTKPSNLRTSTITNVSEFAEVRPRSHVDYIHHNTERLLSTGVLVLGSRGKAEPKGNLGFEGGWDGEAPRTTYQEFTRTGSAPALSTMSRTCPEGFGLR